MSAVARAVLVLLPLVGCRQVFALDTPMRRDGAVDISPDPDSEPAMDGSIDGSVDASLARTLVGIIAELGLGTELLVALDAGDAASYDGTSQVWNNTAPGGVGTHFLLGSDTSQKPEDPAFVGTPGGLSPADYFALDGDAWFREATAGWGDDAFHHGDARVTVLALAYSPSPVGYFAVITNCNCNVTNVTTPGFVAARSSSNFTIWYQEGDTNLGSQATSAANYPLGAWSFSAISVSADGVDTNEVVIATNRTIEQITDTAQNYGTMSASSPAAIAADGDGSDRAPDGSRIAMVAVWKRALDATELGMLYDAIKARRFSSLP